MYVRREPSSTWVAQPKLEEPDDGRAVQGNWWDQVGAQVRRGVGRRTTHFASTRVTGDASPFPESRCRRVSDPYRVLGVLQPSHFLPKLCGSTSY